MISSAQVVERLEPRELLTGTWTQIANSPAGGAMMLLTDGTVIAQGFGGSQTWSKLTPDSSGNYVNGTWTSIASSILPRDAFGSNVLPNGNVFVMGGEYTGNGAATYTNTGEIYNPVANTWTAIATFPQLQFGDDPTILLPNGEILAGYLLGPQTYLFNPSTNTWSQTGSKLLSDRSDEETWALLPDGSVITADVFVNGHAQRYFPSTGQWVDAGTVPVALSSSAVGYEMGPGGLLPNGNYLQIGATGNSAIYNPTSNTWSAGPSLPAGMGADDAPGAMLPNGQFIFVADTTLFQSPSKVYDYDYTTNSFSDITPTGSLGSILASGPAFINRMLVTPNGHVLVLTGSPVTLWDYAPDGSPNSTWEPTITSVQQISDTNYTLSGTQLTGISEGASYGDDAEMSTNFPIVSVTNTSTGAVTYARTTGWTPGVATEVP